MTVPRRRMRRRLREYRNRLSKRVIRDRNYSKEIFDRFQFRLPTITYIMNNIEHSINHNSKKNYALPPVLKLLTCLRFLTTGAYYRLVWDSIWISETTTGRCCRSVCDAIISNLLTNTITFPKDNLARHTKQQFLKVAGIKKSFYCENFFNFIYVVLSTTKIKLLQNTILDDHALKINIIYPHISNGRIQVVSQG